MRRARGRAWRGGEPLVWLTGGALAVALVMVGGLIGIILVNGLGLFWVRDVVRLGLADGRTVTGQVVERERIVGPAPRYRIKLRVGNRDLYGADFVWVDEASIVRRERPADLALVERTEWGPLLGTIVELRDGDAVVARGPAARGELERRLGEVARRRRTMLRLERDEIGEVNRAQERVRLALRRLELQGAAGGERAAALRRQAAVLEGRYRALEARLAELRSGQTARLVVAADGGRRAEVPLAQVLAVLFPNAMSTGDKVRQYAVRLWAFVADDPREANTEGGVFPAIFGTVLMVLIMSVVVTPVGVLAALYLREYARQGPFVSAVRVAVNNLAGVPSIVFGVFGVGFFVYGVGGALDRLLFPEALPAPTFGTGGILWASLTLALLTVPVVIVATEEGLAALPPGLREASLALGATRLETTLRVVLPAVTPSILTGLILAMARAAGEVAPLMLTGVVKLAPALPVDGTWPFVHLERKFMHLGFHIYDVGFQSPNVDAARPMVFATTLLLLGIVVVLNLTAIAVRHRLRRRDATAAV
ncbi:MAG TPA: phosphate ABC transporter permease PstA [Calidithermus sp.]|nr:phosphate ABC transporter permease PstA [Calidithermus sp.]